jgi:hypothetical protein
MDARKSPSDHYPAYANQKVKAAIQIILVGFPDGKL